MNKLAKYQKYISRFNAQKCESRSVNCFQSRQKNLNENQSIISENWPDRSVYLLQSAFSQLFEVFLASRNLRSLDLLIADD